MHAGTWAKRRARAVRLRFVARNLPAFAALVLLFSAIALFVWTTTEDPWRSCVIGMVAVGCAWMVHILLVRYDGSESWRRGAEGEDRTAVELGKLRRYGWHVVSHVPFAAGDVDHLLVGPGGVVAVETKTRSREWRDHGCTRQAAASAQRVHLLLAGAGVEVAVEPLVYVWAPTGGDLPVPTRRMGDVQVWRGADSAAWRTRMLQRPRLLTEADVATVLQVVDEYLRLTRAWDREAARVLRGPDPWPQGSTGHGDDAKVSGSSA